MKNPWLFISYTDYEGHMNDPEVDQFKVINKLTKKHLDLYKPKKFALAGCCTGNGLEHVNNSFTKEVFAIDINSSYLNTLKERYENTIKGLKTIHADVENNKLNLSNINLVFIALLLEYTKVEKTLKNIIDILATGGILVIVIQKNNNQESVTNTSYSSLKILSSISHEVDLEELKNILLSLNMDIVNIEEIKLINHKSFISITSKRK